MKAFWLSALLLTSVPAWAAPWAATPAERAMCQAQVLSHGGNGHHCDGLRFLYRAYAAVGKTKQYYLQESMYGFNWVLRKESYVLRGDAHFGKARALKLMGKNAEAAAEFNKALSYKLDSPDVYQALADHYHEAGNKQKAMEIVTEGLKRNPNSIGLKRRYTEFGGKLPYPEAVDKTMPNQESKVEDKPEGKIGVEQSPGEATSEVADADKPATPTEMPPQVDPPKIGSPKNPYCRFCPD